MLRLFSNFNTETVEGVTLYRNILLNKKKQKLIKVVSENNYGLITNPNVLIKWNIKDDVKIDNDTIKIDNENQYDKGNEYGKKEYQKLYAEFLNNCFFSNNVSYKGISYLFIYIYNKLI